MHALEVGRQLSVVGFLLLPCDPRIELRALNYKGRTFIHGIFSPALLPPFFVLEIDLFLYYLRQGHFLHLEVTNWLAWPKCKGPWASLSLVCSPSIRVTGKHGQPAYVHARDPSPGPHVCTASTLPLSHLSPQSQVGFFASS